MAVPSRDWNENTPADTGQVSQGASDMRTIRDDVKDRLEREHVLNTSDSANDGYHLGGSAVLYTTTSAPTTAPDGTALVATAASSADAGRLWKPPGGRIRAYEKTTAAGTTLSWREAAPTVEETALLATTQTITGDKTFSGAVDVTTTNTITGDLTFSGNHNITSLGALDFYDGGGVTDEVDLGNASVETTFVVPAGRWFVAISMDEINGSSTAVLSIQLQATFVGGPTQWFNVFAIIRSDTTNGRRAGLPVVSDGTNLRVRAAPNCFANVWLIQIH